MHKIYLLFAATISSVAAFAQTPITDSIQTGAGYANEVWYSFANGKVSEAPAAEWQLAFSGSSVIRTNSASQSNAVTLYVSPTSVASDTSAWLTFDTSGYASWTKPVNSDSIWGKGAFNQDGSGATNYGWGVYAGSPTHDVVGVKAYLVKYGSSFKRLFIKVKGSGFGGGSANWEVRVANIDGSDVKYISFAGNSATKNFVYVNLDNGISLDHEPAKTDWDFVLTRYHEYLTYASQYYGVTGILVNNGIKVSEVRKSGTVTLADTATFPFSTVVSTIGSDWKSHIGGGVYATVDTLTYFVKVTNGDIYRLDFTKFANSTGNVVFNKTKVYPSLGGGTTDSLKVNQTTLSYVIGGESKNVTVASSQAWTATTSDSWITLNPASGAAGSGSVSITAAANTGAARTGSVTFTAGTLNTNVSVSQAGTTTPPSAGIDSIQTGNGYANEVWYSFANGKVKEAPAAEWKLAFSTGLTNVAVRTNSSAQAAGAAVTLYEVPGNDTTQWASLVDTAGLSTWNTPYNSDEDWQKGAFNTTATGHPDYGWGTYDDITHIVTGSRLYVAKYGSSFKKIFILDKNYGVWHVRIANLDGTAEQTLTIPSNNYTGKNFAYVNWDNTGSTVLDREPASADWDFVLTRYWETAIPYHVTGILTNTGIQVAEVKGVPATASTLADTVNHPFSNKIATIGSDWKQLNSSYAYYIADSLSYFVKVRNGDIYKLVFTKFTSSTGTVVFNATRLFNVGLETVKTNSIKTFTVYPNPTSDVVNVLFDVENEHSVISIMDLSGRTLFTQNVTGNGFQNQAVDVSNLTKGIYLLNVVNGNSRSVQKVVVN